MEEVVEDEAVGAGGEVFELGRLQSGRSRRRLGGVGFESFVVLVELLVGFL